MRNRSQFLQFRHLIGQIIPLLLGLLLLGGRVNAQDLNGVKIQVAADALTYLKFNGEIKRFEFGGSKDDYTGQVVESDQLRIKTLNANPTPTNLVVSEGGRTHIFIIQVMKKIDINNFKAYYDFSDLKALKKLAASQATEPTKDITAPEEKPLIVAAAQNDNQGARSDVPDKKARKQAEKEAREQEKARKDQEKAEAAAKQQQEEQDRKDKEEADRKLAQAAKDKEDAKQRQEAAAKEQIRLKQESAAKAKEDAAEQKRMKAEQAQRDKDAAAAKAREQQLAKEKQQEEAQAKQQAAAAEKQRQKEEKEEQAREAQRQKDIAAAKEKDRQAAIAKADEQRKKEEAARQKIEQARRDQKAKEDAIAAAKEKQRLADEAKEAAAEKERQKQEEIARKKQEAIEKERIRREEAIKQQQIAMEKEKERQAEAERQAAIAKEQARIKQEQKIAAEKARKEEQARKDEEARKLAEIRAKERAEALVKNPYWKTEWHKKYPQINFGEGPVGQLYAGEYFVPRDTMYNSNAANALIAQNGTLKKNYEAEKDGVKLKIVNIGFRGVNAYFQLHITNNSDKDFLVGKMQLTWWKKADGGGLYLNPAYVTDFPVIPAGKDVTIIFGCHGVNAKDEDDFAFTMNERISNTELQILFPANLYNKQMLLQKKREQ